MNPDTIIREAEQTASRVVLGNSTADRLERESIVRKYIEAALRLALQPKTYAERLTEISHEMEFDVAADFSAVVGDLQQAIESLGEVYATDPDDTLAALEEIRRDEERLEARRNEMGEVA